MIRSLVLFILLSQQLFFAAGDDPLYVQDVVHQTVKWEWLVEREIDRMELTHQFAPDLILAIIAQESQGNPTLVCEDHWGSTGLMQVGPREWVGSQEELMDPAFNVRWGLWLLDIALTDAKGDISLALQYYNCGQVRVMQDASCGQVYADRVLRFWLPRIQEEIGVQSVALDAFFTNRVLACTHPSHGLYVAHCVE